MQAENVSVPLIEMTCFHLNNICFVMGFGNARMLKGATVHS